MQKLILKCLLAGALALGLFSQAALGQGNTTSAMSGVVTDQQGKPVAGATVTVLNEPSGTKATAVTRANGRFDLSGLRPGGPYTVTAVAANNPEATRKDIYLELGDSEAVSLVLGTSDVVKLEAFKVEGDRADIFDTGKIGTGSNFTSSEVENIASVRRNVQDIAQLDTRVALMNLSNNGEMSAQGQNYRYNSFLVDNVQTNDTFGLNSNGFSSLRSPIPFEALQAVSVELNPYDVRRAGFTGALINAVTKSGTNHFSGMAYGEYTDQYMRAKNPVSQAREVFRERTYGGTLGGPIVPGHLFFFFSYDNFRRQTPPPTLNLTLDPTQVGQIVARAKTFGYEPGDFTGAQSLSLQKVYLGKLDWNINSIHRLSVSYRRLRGLEPVFPFFGGNNTSFSNYWYDTSRKTDSYTAQLFSNWTQNFRTEATFSTDSYDGSNKNHGAPFPSVFIQGLTATRVADGVVVQTGTVDLGTNVTYQLNKVNTKSKKAVLSGEYSLGEHVVTAGADYQRSGIYQAFISNAYGSYTFKTLGDWLSGTNGSLSQTVLAPGKVAQDAYADYVNTTVGLYAQDLWKPTPRLSLMAGVRLDTPDVSRAPTTIPTTATYSEASFQTAFGIPSTGTNDGNRIFSPRAGFTYKLDSERKTLFRGGIGLFSGTNPAVWLANAYENRGLTNSVTTANATFSPSLTNTGTGNPAVAAINLTSGNFYSPAVWKANLAIDHTLPFGGLILTAEISFLRNKFSPYFKDLNLKPVGNNPDGRIRYAGAIVASSTGNSRGSNSSAYTSSANYLAAGFSDVFELVDSHKGGGGDFTLKLTRPLKNNWAASLAWTHSDYTEVSPVTATGSAISFFNTRAVFNPNENVASTSNYNIPDKFVGQLSYKLTYFKQAPTTFAFTWQGRTGRPYSWVFAGDANGDGFTFNDLFYMPSGPSDPNVRWNSTTERDNFFAYAASAGLTKYAGGVVPRNSEHSNWTQTLDLRFTQVIPLYRNLNTEIYASLLNVGNLLNRKWGLVDELPFSYKRAIAGTTYDAVNKQYIYTFTPSTLDPVPVSADGTSSTSRWQVQAGMRIRF